MLNNEPIFDYSDYSAWSKLLAKNYSVIELVKMLKECYGNKLKYSEQHLAAIEKTTSMTSNSQRRAQSKNNVVGNYEKLNAIENALELHQYYPQYCKNNQ